MPGARTQLQPKGGDQPSSGVSITVIPLVEVKASRDSDDMVRVAIASSSAPSAITFVKEGDQSTVPVDIFSLNKVLATEEETSSLAVPSLMKKFTMTEPFATLSITILSSLTPLACATSFLKSDLKPSISVATSEKSALILKRTSTTEALRAVCVGGVGVEIGDGEGARDGVGVGACGVGEGGGDGGGGGGGVGDGGGGGAGGGHEPWLHDPDST
mmetsp:Transcript_95715/g.169931  ORF Transcript_95715/g.169931 Transcript_95715/m.169931 type:complete len:215 (+) Transcript_95715:338-982(+)